MRNVLTTALEHAAAQLLCPGGLAFVGVARVPKEVFELKDKSVADTVRRVLPPGMRIRAPSFSSLVAALAVPKNEARALASVLSEAQEQLVKFVEGKTKQTYVIAKVDLLRGSGSTRLHLDLNDYPGTLVHATLLVDGDGYDLATAFVIPTRDPGGRLRLDAVTPAPKGRIVVALGDSPGGPNFAAPVFHAANQTASTWARDKDKVWVHFWGQLIHEPQANSVTE